MQYKRIEPALRKKHKKQLRVTLATGPLGPDHLAIDHLVEGPMI